MRALHEPRRAQVSRKEVLESAQLCIMRQQVKATYSIHVARLNAVAASATVSYTIAHFQRDRLEAPQ